jgi:lipoprotein-anchoring transpeptidase ErfK/SrfK
LHGAAISVGQHRGRRARAPPLSGGNGRALRYAVGVGRAEALNFRGSAVIGRKESWPRWTPTAHMMAAMPSYRLAVWTAAPNNPLGARALYLYRDGGDTYLRLHGTNEPESIGHAVSSGCIRCSIRISLISTTASRWARM